MLELSSIFLLVGLWGFAATLICIPFVKRIALKYQIVAHPGGHNNHDKPTPLLGGVAIFLPLIPISCLLFFLALSGRFPADKPDNWQMASLFLSSAWILILGIIDDKYTLSWKKKVWGECLGVVILLVGGHTVRGVMVPLLGPIPDLGWLGILLFAFLVLTITNAINLIDGLDGLAAGICFFAAITSAIIGISKLDYFTAAVGSTLAGSLLAFLKFNFPPASIFMGDAGSLMLGFLLGTLATSSSALAPGIRSGTMGMMIIPLLPFGIALLDIILAILRRWISGQDIFLPDSDHLHHRLLEKFRRPRQVVTLLYGFSASLCVMTLFLVWGPKSALIYGVIFLTGLIVLALTAMILKTYTKESLCKLIENRTHFQFLSSYRNFMSQRLRRARSFDELVSLAESGVKDLGYDSVEILQNNQTLRHWANQFRVHPEAPRFVMEKSLSETSLQIRWIAPKHYSESYQKYLQAIWDQFLAQLESELQNFTDSFTPRPRNLFSQESNIIGTEVSLNNQALQNSPVPFYVITVNYYSKRFLPELIRSISPLIFLDKLIIINHSSYEELDDLQAEFDIHIINQGNKGYGSGLNRGLREVVKDNAVALLCNPDISLLNPQAIPGALRYMTDHPRVACLIPQLVNYELKPNHACRQFYTLKTLLAARIPWVYNRSPQFLRNHLYLDHDRNGPFEIDWGCGGAMLVKTSLFPSPLFFDERFFLYFEDVDLCAQVYKNNLSVVFFPELLFCHYERKSSHNKILFLIQHLWSLGKFIWKYRGLPQRATLYQSPLLCPDPSSRYEVR